MINYHVCNSIYKMLYSSMLLHNMAASKIRPGGSIFYSSSDVPNELVLATKILNNTVHIEIKYGNHHQTDVYGVNDKFTILSVK